MGRVDMMMGCGKGSAPVGEAVREVSKLCKGNAGLSPSLGLHYSTPVPSPPFSGSAGVLSSSVHPLTYVDVAHGCHSRG